MQAAKKSTYCGVFLPDSYTAFFHIERFSGDRSGDPKIPLEAFHNLRPIPLHPREWVVPIDRGDERPRVINDALIQEQYKKYSEITREQAEMIEAYPEVGILFEDMTELKLEYRNILHIANLEKCCNLKKLSLNNNVIESPVGLGSLIHLEELDLSYNKLTTLRSIHLLRKLRVLRLNNNLISKIDLLKYNHRCLEVLNLGFNKITDFPETLLYLSALPNLKSLSLDGNPFWGGRKKTDKLLKIVLFYFLPQLRFYEHRIITFAECYPSQADLGEAEVSSNEEERRIVIVKRVLNKFKADEPGLIHRLDAIRTEILSMDVNEEEAYNKLALESILEQLCLAGFRYGKGFHALMEKDPEGRELMSLSKRIKDEVFGRLEEAMEPVILDITRCGITFFRSRQECIDKFIQKWDSVAENHAIEREQITLKFLEEVKDVQMKLLTSFNSDNTSEELAERNMKEVLLYDKEFIILTKKFWWELMDIEMAVHSKLEEMFEALDEELMEKIQVYIEPFQEKVVKLRKVEEEFFEYLMDFMNHYVNELVSNKWERRKLNDHQKKILFSSETRSNIMTQCHDNHTSFIDIEEEDAVEQLRHWQSNLASSCRSIESDNNRREVDEIHKFIVDSKASWEETVGEPIRVAYTFLWVVDPRWTKDIMYFKMNYEDRQMFDELENTVRKKTLTAITLRKQLEREKEVAAAKEEERRAEMERRIQMRRLRSLVMEKQEPKKPSLTPPMGKSEKEKAKETALKEMASLKEIDLSFENLQKVVLAEESSKRESQRRKKEREWKSQGDVERMVHLIGGGNLKTYQILREKIVHSEDSEGSD
ncbi:hypothetical protein GE061_019344 [Apolygus lucorum]|uniref:Dynein axonemal assembly factor 1 homolog n=1 Tax=Apolygus lucorum TaxID=248454 RepID=A0A8S9X873_APOLU|nr:hypothetical protein GE061_019344 [Apolygus lucorum]